MLFIVLIRNYSRYYLWSWAVAEVDLPSSSPNPDLGTPVIFMLQNDAMSR